MSPDAPSLIGQSPAFVEVLERVSRLAQVDRPVLVVGERGTGKELIAARLHFLSRRWDRPFVQINCAALAETLLESELFGHEAGAFTGAVRRRAGRFERADGGSLFLDEIATASSAVQEKVLRVVEYGTFERVGASAAVQVDVRLIAATNADLPALVSEGRFRADLLDRLSFEVVTLPPLRARREDIRLLASHFGIGMATAMGWPSFPGFAEAALEAMEAHPWPGNVREIRNVVERAVHRWEDPGTPIAALVFDPFESPYRPGRPAAAAQPPAGQEGTLTAIVAETERRLVDEALASCRYNRRQAARRLGVSYDQLRTLIRRHGLR